MSRRPSFQTGRLLTVSSDQEIIDPRLLSLVVFETFRHNMRVGHACESQRNGIYMIYPDRIRDFIRRYLLVSTNNTDEAGDITMIPLLPLPAAATDKDKSDRRLALKVLWLCAFNLWGCRSIGVVE